ncbi:sugar-transfer associated ATP-grasp domain-containing protein [Dongia rigui]|uniref:Sugar-transfer associated ATP-grasp domain-containing protein n=1 Tax=Dongia rigui TaxID=940149 RepID=A0ABU5DZW1_9PROT|nr:sugar-transfer associated ATP-grasp domain-containing protein [Dongia rigui]MDY0872086.1 sugar-transfer associated ATP-grasp domain-containing protein [Dongia rigui]
MFSLATAVMAFILLLSPLRSSDFVIDPLNALVATVMGLTLYRRLQVSTSHVVLRAAAFIWLSVLVVTLVLEWLPVHRAELRDVFSLKESAEVFLWLLAPIGLFIVSRFERVPALVKLLLICGFLVQTVVVGLEFIEESPHLGVSPDGAETFSDFAQFVFLQFYLIAFALLLLYAGWSPISRHAESDVHSGPLGNRARHIFDAYRLFTKGRFPKQRVAHWPGVLPIIDFGRIVLWTGTLGMEVQRNFGVPIFRQIIDILLLMMHCGLDAQAYYMLELYRRDRQRKAGQYLTRYETKNGLLTALNYLIPKNGHRSNLSDKAAFDRVCVEHGLEVPRILAVAQHGEIAWRNLRRLTEVPGLFVKPAVSKGARGTEIYTVVRNTTGTGSAQYMSPDGTLLSELELSTRIAGQSMEEMLLVQERLENAPSVAPFAQASLVVIRVITCLDAQGRPTVTHGMLRVLSKLEAGWPSAAEYGAPVDLATGELGWLSSDKREDAFDFFDHHPVTGARVAGALLPEWAAVKALALRAHDVFNDRFVIGWDIAVTPEGPVLIEGNAYPDFAFLQRVHRQPAGESPIGPLLQSGLDRLVAVRGG